MDVETLIAQIEAGSFDSSLGKVKAAIDSRMSASRKTRTLDDYHVGEKVVFNELTATRYMVGQQATIVSKKLKKVVVRLETPKGRFAHTRLDGEVQSALVTAPIEILDLV